ncbi:MAG TPA: hypothetical protein VFP44_10635 [Usitatibacter sp.]|nr:hypothetical protein [Usitatibacter sp.]
MSALEVLARRRELVRMSCDLQRMTIATLLDHAERHPAQLWLGGVMRLAGHPWLRPMAMAIAARALRRLRRRRRRAA